MRSFWLLIAIAMGLSVPRPARGQLVEFRADSELEAYIERVAIQEMEAHVE